VVITATSKSRNLQIKNRMKKLLLLAAASLAVTAANATLYTTNFNWSVNQTVPDNNYSGWANSQIISGQSGTISPGSLLVSLDLAGGWNGDLYAYLVHGTGFAVLLDRVGTGVSGVSSFGYGDAGMNVNLAATGTSIHQYGGINNTFPGSPAGSWLTDNTSGSLASFLSTTPNGTWSLFIADLSGGGVSTVQSWGLQMDIVAVPEVETWVAAALAGAFGAFWLNRAIWNGVKK